MNAPLPAPEFWRGRRVLLTGHTGFKGAWAALWLKQLGARVTGFALAPSTTPALFHLAEVSRDLDSRLGDLRDPQAVREAVTAAELVCVAAPVGALGTAVDAVLAAAAGDQVREGDVLVRIGKAG